jgi:DNA-binding NarL/FixJ family response regulator
MSLSNLELFDGLALLCAVGGGLLAFNAWRAQRLAQRSLANAALLTARVSGLEQSVERLLQQNSDYGPRLDWIETRVRQTELNKGTRPADKAEPAADPKRQSITERRHRVLALAKRGLEAQQIAATLGVPHGEVELIISLHETVGQTV